MGRAVPRAGRRSGPASWGAAICEFSAVQSLAMDSLSQHRSSTIQLSCLEKLTGIMLDKQEANILESFRHNEIITGCHVLDDVPHPCQVLCMLPATLRKTQSRLQSSGSYSAVACAVPHVTESLHSSVSAFRNAPRQPLSQVEHSV